jgi:hypothetical protein
MSREEFGETKFLTAGGRTAKVACREEEGPRNHAELITRMVDQYAKIADSAGIDLAINAFCKLTLRRLLLVSFLQTASS